MNYSEYKDKHAGETVLVFGCGQSAKDLVEPNRFITIGCNDIGRLFTPNYLVVLNDKNSFNPPDRWIHIQKTQAPVVFTHINTLDVPNEKKVLLGLGKYGGLDWESGRISYTSNSPYVSCIIAAFMGAKRIGLLGVDFTLHHFFGDTGQHMLANKLNSINREYVALHQAFAAKNIELVNLSQQSQIAIPKKTISEFLGV